ncbi:hypothetical protein THA_823 [Thermosipho africanus TCF52B]|uniref:Uncharacterized protein n=1 Tax=Thermosipho africanus (strain TCF52B) TaxID=484019 RepID=B7IGS1_THEAB|nr:hypothetical protein THA_823 [Thermosipho africanus TCF52B]MDK2886531.1 hypothetical protein [Thermosipho sp. (in: thermotogales)]
MVPYILTRSEIFESKMIGIFLADNKVFFLNFQLSQFGLIHHIQDN